MKKLIPMLLTTAFAFAGVLGSTTTTVLANNIASMESVNTQILLPGSWPLEINRNMMNVTLENSDEIYRFIPINEALESLNITDFNFDGNTLEITNNMLSNYQELRELTPIIEPIDMENINIDEWVSSNVLLTASGWNSMSFDMITISLRYQTRDQIPQGMDWNYWFENYFEETTMLSSVLGCNAEEFRSIAYSQPFRMDFMFNLEDILESGMLSDTQVERLFLEKEREEAIRNGIMLEPTEASMEEWRQSMVFQISSHIPSLSANQLGELIEVLENQL